MAKSKFEKVMNNDTVTVTNTKDDTTLFTADEDFVLERIVGHMQWLHSEDNAQVKVFSKIHVRPSGTDVTGTAHGQDFNEPDSYWVLWCGQLSTTSGSTADVHPWILLPIDMKIRRQVQEGDTIVLSTITDSASANYMTHSITVFMRRQ